MTVEELIEALRAMPSTSRVDIDYGKLPADFDDDDILTGDPVKVVYEFGITTIKCEAQ